MITDTNNSNMTEANAQDLLDNGPKNELYLAGGQSVVFSVTGYENVQVGLKSLSGTGSATINSTAVEPSNVEMFYQAAAGTITITNTGSSLLSVTLVKASTPTTNNASASSLQFSALTEEDLMPALLSLGFEAEEEAPEEVPVTPVKPARPTQDFGKLYSKIEKVLKRFFG